MTLSTLTLALLLPALAAAVPCVQFDYSFNLYAFGGEQDVALGASSAWASPSPKPLSSDGRPPWNGNNSQCLLAQNANAMYVLGADSSDPGAIYIYDFAGDKWSKQVTTGTPAALQNSRSSAILDHDTNTIFTMAGDDSSLFSLEMTAITNTAAGSLEWIDAGRPRITTAGYKVTAAQASNHINYYGVPGTAAGSANMFVIHYNYFQPEAATYPAVGGGKELPASSGQAVSILQTNSTPYQNLFIPDDFSGSYVVTHWTAPGSYNDTTGAPMAVSLINTTQSLPAPTSQDKEAAYACSDTDCVQIDTKGDIYYIANAVAEDFTVSSGATWQKMGYSLKPYVAPAATPNATDASGSTTATGSAAAATSGAATSGGAASPSGSAASGAELSVRGGSLLGWAFGIAALAVATIA